MDLEELNTSKYHGTWYTMFQKWTLPLNEDPAKTNPLESGADVQTKPCGILANADLNPH